MDRLKGSIYGFIIGDALGVPVEFFKKEFLDSHPVVDMLSSAYRNTSVGYWSDDTAMTLCTMESISELNMISYRDIMDKFKLWVEKGYMTSGDVCFGIGQRTIKALNLYNKELKNPNYSKDQDDDSWITKIGELSVGENEKNFSGNGSLMRMLPVVLFLKYSDKNIKQKIDVISKMSSLTHSSVDCIMACAYYMILIENILNGKDKKESIELTNTLFKEEYSDENNIKFEEIINMKNFTNDIDNLKTTGYVVDTLATSLWCFYNCDDYKNTVLTAVNLGGDTDTIAAIAGSLSGLYYGYGSIPSDWISKLMKKEMIEDKINNFLSIVCRKDDKYE